MLSTGAENRKSSLAELLLWPIKYLCDGGRVAQGTAAAENIGAGSKGRVVNRVVIEAQAISY